MEVYKLEVLVVDEDSGYFKHVIDTINQMKYGDDMKVFVVNCSKTVEIGEWDDSPLSCYETIKDEMNRLFPKE